MTLKVIALAVKVKIYGEIFLWPVSTFSAIIPALNPAFCVWKLPERVSMNVFTGGNNLPCCLKFA